MNKKESIALYEKGVEAWNIWANDMLAKKAALEENKRWQIDLNNEATNQATKNWMNDSSIDFSEHTFEESVNFSCFIFPYFGDFSEVIFSDEASFNNATFSDGASFYNATFNGEAWFYNATFNGEAWFDNATFSDGASFDNATFSGEARLYNATFSSLTWFDNATFSGGARFQNATFSDEASFDEAVFSDEASFNNATFGGEAWFQNATFRSKARFNNATFSDNTRFNQTLFEGFASFEKTSLKKSSFIAIIGQSYFSFKDTVFHLVPDFNQAHFIEAPQFDDSDFSEALNHNQSESKDNLSSRWRSLKRLAIQGHDHERELIFFAAEIKSQRGIQDKAFPNLLAYFNKKSVWPGGTRYWLGYFYQYLSDFGRSVMRPLLWLLILGVLFYFFYLEYPLKDKSTKDNPINQVTISRERPEAAIYLSAQSALPFLPATRYSENINRSYACLYGKNSDGKANIPNTIVFISIIQTILSTILIFLTLLALRNYFRIK